MVPELVLIGEGLMRAVSAFVPVGKLKGPGLYRWRSKFTYIVTVIYSGRVSGGEWHFYQHQTLSISLKRRSSHSNITFRIDESRVVWPK